LAFVVVPAHKRPIRYEIGATTVAALAALTLSLGVTYWLMRELDEGSRSGDENAGSPKPGRSCLRKRSAPYTGGP
jgi:hypothetical protein